MRWDIFFFAGGAVIAALAVKYADKPWLWDGTLYVGVASMGGAVLDYLIRKIWARGIGRRMIPFTGLGLCCLGFVAFGAWYLWPMPTDAQIKLLTSLFPVSPQQAEPRPTSPGDRKTLMQSTFGVFLYKCTIPESHSDEEANNKEAMKEAEDIAKSMFGIDLKIIDLPPAGRRFELRPATPVDQAKWGFVTMLVIEMRRIDEMLFVKYTFDYQSPISMILSLVPLNGELAKQIDNKLQLSKSLGMPCQML